MIKKKEKERTEEGINELDRNCSIRTTGKKQIKNLIEPQALVGR